MHSYVRSHATESVALVTADRTSKSFDALVSVHVTLSSPCGRTDRAAYWTFPSSGRTARARVRSACLDHRLQLQITPSTYEKLPYHSVLS